MDEVVGHVEEVNGMVVRPDSDRPRRGSARHMERTAIDADQQAARLDQCRHTYSTEEVVGKEIVEANGGQVCVTGKIAGVSTTDILSSVRKTQAQTIAIG